MSSGVFRQAVIDGLSGMRFGEAGFEARYAPTLADGLGSLTLPGLPVRVARGDLALRRQADRVQRSVSRIPVRPEPVP